MIRCPKCYICEHFSDKKEICEAYPDGIPENIIMESIFYDEGHECAEGVFCNLKRKKKDKYSY